MNDATATQGLDPLAQLRELSTVVADTGDIEEVARLAPTDATTNPSLVLAAADKPAYAALLAQARDEARRHGAAAGVDELLVCFGQRISASIPRWVSTEVDARLSFDADATVERAHALLERYAARGVAADRVLIKIAATWEGIAAARRLQAEGVRCNMTLIFSLVQAAACAEAGATLISPFVGRILDWHKAQQPDADFDGERDPGVQSVRSIHAFFKDRGYETLVMGASFRNTGEIRALAGCDLLTISPKLMDALAAESEPLENAMGSAEVPPAPPADESGFRFALNDDAMANDRLADGIRRFAADQVKLEALVAGG